MNRPSLADVVRHLEELFPPDLAESWDAVGMVAGDPAASVRKVLFAVDPVDAVITEALEWGADLLVTHHPLFLRPVHGVPATTFKGSIVHRLIQGGCGLFVAHTNADAAAGGVADSLAEALGLQDRVPMIPAPGQEAIGTGRVGVLRPQLTLREFAERVARVLPATAQGVRVAGDLDAMVSRVAVCGGSGDSLFDAVRAADADAYVTADLRHHPASELRERAETGVGPGGRPFLIDVAHFASEWPWLTAAAADLAARLAPQPDVAGAGSVSAVEMRVSTLVTDPWTARIASVPPSGAPSAS